MVGMGVDFLSVELVIDLISDMVEALVEEISVSEPFNMESKLNYAF